MKKKRRDWIDPAMLFDSVRDAKERAALGQERKTAMSDFGFRRSTLTPRETALFALLTEGCANKVIAAKLGMSVRTAEHHERELWKRWRLGLFCN